MSSVENEVKIKKSLDIDKSLEKIVRKNSQVSIPHSRVLTSMQSV